jgi:hypothetical protein
LYVCTQQYQAPQQQYVAPIQTPVANQYTPYVTPQQAPTGRYNAPQGQQVQVNFFNNNKNNLLKPQTFTP